MKTRRYQLRKEAVGAAMHHPWIFRGHMSSAADALRDGELLRLVDGTPRRRVRPVRGHRRDRGPDAAARTRAPTTDWLRDRITSAIARRAALAERTDAIRLIHGESDSLPAV